MRKTHQYFVLMQFIYLEKLYKATHRHSNRKKYLFTYHSISFLSNKICFRETLCRVDFQLTIFDELVSNTDNEFKLMTN